MSGWTTRVAPVRIVFAVLVAMVGAQWSLAAQALATPVVDGTEPPPAGAAVESRDEISTLAATATVSHSFSNPTPSPGETVTVRVQIAGDANAGDSLVSAEKIFTNSAPLVHGEPAITNMQNVVITEQGETPINQSSTYLFSRFTVPLTGHYAFTYTFTVTIDPAQTSQLEFRGAVLLGDQTLVEDIVYLPVASPPTDTPVPTATSTLVPPTNTPVPTTTITPTPTNTSEPTASNTLVPITTTASVSHAFSNPSPISGETVTVTVVVAGETDSPAQLRFVARSHSTSAPHVAAQPVRSNLQNIVISNQIDTSIGTTDAEFVTDFSVPAAGHFELTLTYTVTIDPAETGPLQFQSKVYDPVPRELASDDVTLSLKSPQTPTNTVQPTNTPEPTATSTAEPTATATSVPSTNTPVPPTSTAEPTATSTLEPTTTPVPRGSAVITLETSDGEDIPGATTLCVAGSCLTVGAQAPRFFQASRNPVAVPSGSTFTFDDLPIGTLNVTATDASPYLNARASITTIEDEPVELALVLQMDEPDTTATDVPQPTGPQPTATSPVTILPETGNRQPGSSATWMLLAAACVLLASTGAIVRNARQPMDR